MVGRAAEFLRLCTRHWFNEYDGGHEWSAYPAYLSYGRVVGRTDIDYSKWIHYEKLAEVGPRYMHPDWVMVAERPVQRNYDMTSGRAELRPGVQVAYRDVSQIVDGEWQYRLGGDDRIDIYDLVDGDYLPIATEGRIDDRRSDLWATRAKSLASQPDKHDAFVIAERQMLEWLGAA